MTVKDRGFIQSPAEFIFRGFKRFLWARRALMDTCGRVCLVNRSQISRKASQSLAFSWLTVNSPANRTGLVFWLKWTGRAVNGKAKVANTVSLKLRLPEFCLEGSGCTEATEAAVQSAFRASCQSDTVCTASMFLWLSASHTHNCHGPRQTSRSRN